MADEEKEEKTYEVKDKRRVNPDGSLREEPAGEGEAPAEPQVAQAAGEGEAPAQPEVEPPEPEVELPAPNVYVLLEFMAGMLAEQAWQLMGIRLAPGQKEMTRDLGQAKIAIDMVVHISDTIHPHVGEAERVALRSLVSDLQINFVRQSA